MHTSRLMFGSQEKTLTAYDEDPEISLDPTYGSIVFSHWGWGPQNDGKFAYKRKPIESHSCSRVELGLDREKSSSKFLPVYKPSL